MIDLTASDSFELGFVPSWMLAKNRINENKVVNWTSLR